MRRTVRHDLSVAVYVHRSRMRAYVQIVGGLATDPPARSSPPSR